MTGVVIAPFSNSAIRDWPAEHYAALIGLLIERRDDGETIRVIGTPGQRLSVCEIVRDYPAGHVINECGRLNWPDVLSALRSASCVIGNNSGIAHVAAHYGTPTVCIFGGSHQRLEWRPRGANVVVLSRAIGCSPCQLDHGALSPYGKACLRDITPEQVCDAAQLVTSRAEPAVLHNQREIVS